MLLSACFGLTGAAADEASPVPLSPAQIALFETPHLKNVTRPETLEYRFESSGPPAFSDSVAEKIEEVHADGKKLVSFAFLSGERREFYPGVDEFSGNPILMIYLEHDVKEMKRQLGIAAAYFRDRIRQAFVDHAEVSDVTISLQGKPVQAKRITLAPFADDVRFEKVPAIQGKRYSFVVSDEVPGGIEEMAAEIPADPAAGLPEWHERVTFAEEKP